MKQLIEDLISMMEYHVEQTRPIHTTTVALQAAREALKAMPAPVQEPVAFEQWFSDYLGPLTTKFERSAMRAAWNAALENTPPAAQRQWVGLTDEEKETLSYEADGNTWAAVELAEAKLKEKNNG
jgi:hypothetical protein